MRSLRYRQVLALVALVFAFSQAGSVPVAEAVPPQPATMSFDIYMCDGAGGGNPAPFCDNSASTTSGDGDGLIEAGENPEVVTNLWIGLDWTTASDESFFDLANAWWTTGAEGADVTGDGFNDPVAGIAANVPGTLGAAVGRITFNISSNLTPPLLLFNNVDDVVSNTDPTVTGQPPRCGATGTISISDTFEIWNANTALTPTVDHRDLPPKNGCAESQEDIDTDSCTLNNYPKGVSMNPGPLTDIIVGTGMPLSQYMARAYGIARLDIMGVASNGVDVNFVLFNVLDDASNPRYVSITVVQYPGAPSSAPETGEELAQTVATCPPYYSSPVRIFGLSQDPDYDEDGDNTDPNEVGKGGEVVHQAIGASGTFDYVLDKSVAEDYDGDDISATHDRCDTDPATGSALDDTDGDWMTGTCDVLGEGSGCPPSGNSSTIPWDTCQDLDGDDRINQNDNCPNDYDPTNLDSDGDGVGDVCDADPDIVGDGSGYDGGLNDSDNKCVDEFTIGAGEPAAEVGAAPGGGAGKYCVGPASEVGATQNPYINPALYAIGNDPYEDSDDDGVPDYEVIAGVGTLFDADSNSDEDGHTDACEGFSGSDALDTLDVPGGPPPMCDCDGGGRSDEDEVADGTDPFTPGDEVADADEDGDGCLNSEERVCALAPRPGATGPYDPARWYDFYDVPAPAKADPIPNGPKDRSVWVRDVLAVLFYVGTSTGTGTNPNGVNYNSLKDGDWFDSANQIIGSDGMTDSDDAAGRQYDRSPSPAPDPPNDAGPPNGAVTMGDVLLVMAQAGLSCSGPVPPPLTPLPGPNGMALDADAASEPVDTSASYALNAEFDVATNITGASTAYGGYQMMIQFDPAVLAFVPVGALGITYTDLMTSYYTTVVGADTVAGGASLFVGVQTTTGRANLVRFECIADGVSPLHLVTVAENVAFGSITLAPGGADIDTSLSDATITCGAEGPTPTPSATPTVTATPSITPTPGAAVDVQLCFAIDGSGSINSSEFALERDAIAAAVSNPAVLPQDGTVEVSVVQFPGGLEVAPTVIDSPATAAAVFAAISAITQWGGTTPMDQGINDCTAAITGSPEFPTASKQVINLATDGVPNSQAAAIAARDAAVAAGIDQLHAEAVGAGANTTFLLTLVWPQPGELVPSGGTPTDPETTGFVMEVASFDDFGEAILAKVQAIVIPGRIDLSPDADTNFVGQQHTVTATVTESGLPVVGVQVTFTVVGANAGAAGACAPNANCTTNASGQVSFTYTGTATGPDTITASATVGAFVLNDSAEKTWGAIPHQGDIFPVAGGGVGDGLPAPDGSLNEPTGVAVDGDGNVYIADSVHCRVRKVDKVLGTISRVAGNGECGFGGDGGLAIHARLDQPASVALDASGNVYIADTLNCRVRKVDTSGNISTVAGNGVCAFGGDGNAAVNAQLDEPTGVAAAGSDLYIADSLNCRVRKVDSSGDINTVAGTIICGFNGDGQAATSAQLDTPIGVALDGDGNVFIADTDNGRVRVVNTQVSPITVASVNIDPGEIETVAGGLTSPTGVAVDSSGDILIADRDDHLVQKVDSGGAMTPVAGSGGGGYDGEGIAIYKMLNYPSDVAVDDGNLYIADRDNHRVRLVVSGAIDTFAGTGLPYLAFCGDGTVAVGDSCLDRPAGVAVASNGDLYIADTLNNRVRRVERTTGAITTVAGGGAGCAEPCPSTDATLNGPQYIAVDDDGDLYISETAGHRVRRVTAVGGLYNNVVEGGEDIETIAGDGTPAATPCDDYDPATGPCLNEPTGLAILDLGGVDKHLYIGQRVGQNGGDGRVLRVDLWQSEIHTAFNDGEKSYGLAVDEADPGVKNLYIAQKEAHRVLLVLRGGNNFIDPGDASVVVAGTGAVGTNPPDDLTVATAADLNEPVSVVVDADGHVMFSNRGTHTIHVIAPDGDDIVDGGAGELLYRIVGGADPTPGFCGDPVGAPGPAVIAFNGREACLDSPFGLAWDEAESILYLADEMNGRVRKINSDCDLDGLTDAVEKALGTMLCQSDTDLDGCADSEEQTMSFDPLAWYDFFDVPVPANDDAVDGIGADDPVGANGPKNKAVTMGDVLAVLLYVGTYDGDGSSPNPNGVGYDSVKGSCDPDGDTIPETEGLCYDRSPSAEPDPPWEAGVPSGAVTMGDVLAVLAQVGLSCVGPP